MKLACPHCGSTWLTAQRSTTTHELFDLNPYEGAWQAVPDAALPDETFTYVLCDDCGERLTNWNNGFFLCVPGLDAPPQGGENHG